ncbi:MAG: L-threonylcarbamoyladenylate synthase [Atribacterota bacterium]|nr:L-threonylcarbamoyladenylate synthase [Atribacterota bacterium]
MEKIKTAFIEINKDNIDKEKIKIAGKAIKDGKLVAFPTETVYGLGADALNENAVKKIFQVKERPFFDPLIVHISCLEELQDIVSDFPDIAKKISKMFWPGPLTMVMKKNKKISQYVTAGLDTVAVRIPKHPIALELIRESKRPIAAPSANIFTHTSSTNAQHVFTDLKNRIDIIIDGGETSVGVESTVIDVSINPVNILRLGGITVEDLKKVIPDITINQDSILNESKSPGMLKKHYATKAKLFLVEGGKEKMIQEIIKKAFYYHGLGKKIGILSSFENMNRYPNIFIVEALGFENNLELYAHNLYSKMRLLDDLQCDIIISESFENKGLGSAIMDRLRRASN